MIRNLTPHAINVYMPDGKIKTFYSERSQVRAEEQVRDMSPVDGIPVVGKRFIGVTGLPERQEGVLFIVSSIVLAACDREDLIAPDTGPGSVVRDGNGHIVGVKRFQRRII